LGVRVLGIDPGLTRCGVGIVDVDRSRRATLVAVTVLRTPPSMPLEHRLLEIGRGIAALMDEHAPASVALERVFAQHNLPTVMGIAQVSGVALAAAAERGLGVGLHTPSEVKAAVTGYGAADKKQVATMVQRVLGLSELPKPADASDALALALCHAWRGVPAASGLSATSTMTPAQRAWRAAESKAREGRLTP
jgi:crossover junction endodeoxyribonuclease RuvC